MKLALSNLAFPIAESAALLPPLVAVGLRGIEVAPTRIADWDALEADGLRRYRAMLSGLGLEVSSLQAILYGAPGVSLLGSNATFDALVDHLKIVAGIGAELGAGIAVLGAPRQRSRGDLPSDQAFLRGIERLRVVAETMRRSGGPVIGLEPVPASYQGDFLLTWQEVRAMVRAVDHPWLGVHLDTGCVQLGGGAIDEAVRDSAESLVHFHLAEPKLAGFSAPVAEHRKAAQALVRAGYAGWLSIEMLEQSGHVATSLEEAVRFAVLTYASVGESGEAEVVLAG